MSLGQKLIAKYPRTLLAGPYELCASPNAILDLSFGSKKTFLYSIDMKKEVSDLAATVGFLRERSAVQASVIATQREMLKTINLLFTLRIDQPNDYRIDILQRKLTILDTKIEKLEAILTTFP